MTPLRVSFTGLDVDPADLMDRVHHGVIPATWHRYRFIAAYAPISEINRWLQQNIEGRWAIFTSYSNGNREITIAFERNYDGSMFVLSDGAQQCCISSEI
jgi:hypothetical protein